MSVSTIVPWFCLPVFSSPFALIIAELSRVPAHLSDQADLLVQLFNDVSN